MSGDPYYAPYRRADATQDIFIVVGFCMLMFLSGMVVALMLISEYHDYVKRSNRSTVSAREGEEPVLMPVNTEFLAHAGVRFLSGPSRGVSVKRRRTMTRDTPTDDPLLSR